MSAHSEHSGTVIGTVSGTILTIAGNIDSHDILKTVILATVGAVVSFTLSLLLKWAAKKFRKPSS